MEYTKEQLWRIKHHAPELYEACKQMIRDWDNGSIEIDYKTRELINKALSKIEVEA